MHRQQQQYRHQSNNKSKSILTATILEAKLWSMDISNNADDDADADDVHVDDDGIDGVDDEKNEEDKSHQQGRHVLNNNNNRIIRGKDYFSPFQQKSCRCCSCCYYCSNIYDILFLILLYIMCFKKKKTNNDNNLNNFYYYCHNYEPSSSSSSSSAYLIFKQRTITTTARTRRQTSSTIRCGTIPGTRKRIFLFLSFLSMFIFGLNPNNNNNSNTLIEARIIEGEIRTDQDWIFLARFCFLSKEGIFEYNVSYPKSYAPQNLLLYFDAKSQWPAVYKHNKTCMEKQSVLIDDFNQIINLTEYRRQYKATTASGCRLDLYPTENNETWYHCTHHRTFQSYRERWWFIALDNCETKKGLFLRYRITMTNSQTNPWLKHFSADEFYILHTDVIMCILFYLLLFATCFEAYALYTRHLFHKTYKLYIASLLTECLGLLLLCIYYGIYAKQGHANIALKLFGKAFEASSTLIFLLLLLLISKGYTITRARLKQKTVTKFSLFMIMSTIAYVIIFYHEQYAFDPGEVLYMYESSFGYLLISLRLLAWSWFSYAIVFTLIHYPQKSAFFAKLFLVYSIWFISAPIVIFVATFVIPKWMREKIINAVELVIAFKAHLIFFFLTRPSRANKNFPFHVRTTQISIMEKTGNIESGTMEHFNNYKYAPTRSTPIDVFALTSAAFSGLSGHHSNIGPPTLSSSSMMMSNGIGRSGGILSGISGSKTTSLTTALNKSQKLSQRIINSADSEITSVASLSNQSGRTSQEPFVNDLMPKAEA